MKRQKAILCIVWIPVLLCVPFLNAAETKEYSNTQKASVMIRIQADPSFLRIDNYESFDAICNPTLHQAFEEVYGEPHKDHNYQEWVDNSLAVIEFLGPLEVSEHEIAAQGIMHFDLFTLYDYYPMAAQEVKESFLNRLRENLNRAYEEYRQALQSRQEAYERQVAEAQAQMNALYKGLLDISGGKQMSREFLEEQITGLSKELQEREFEVNVHENRLKNLNNQIQEAEQYQREKQAADPIPGELGRKVELLQQQVENTKKMAETGRVPAQDIQEIEQRLIEARIELAHQREMTEQSPEAQRIRELKEQLTQLSLNFSEQQMRMSFLREQIDNVRGLLERSTEYETLRIRTDVQRKALYESIEQLERIRRENGLLTPPILTVISQ